MHSRQAALCGQPAGMRDVGCNIEMDEEQIIEWLLKGDVSIRSRFTVTC